MRSDARTCKLRLACAVLLTLGLLGTPHAPVHAGYRFSISASSSDPDQNSSSSTGTTRILYLWLICTDEGISAFEGDFSGTLTVLGFTPTNGAVNAGGATNLLLGIPDCPTGDSIDLVLGQIIVNDTGGTVCLGPSAQNSVIATVDCDQPLPSMHSSPRVIGFSSSGASPCEVGTNDCVGEGFILGGSGGGSIGSEY
jgi:hypothetical protein